LIAEAINSVCLHLYEDLIIEYIYTAAFFIVVPVSVLIINAIVVREVRRRASSDAATNLGLQRHQSTSSNSAVPTVMLVTTSLVYVLLCGAWSIFYLIVFSISNAYSQYYLIVDALSCFVCAYNFYVYLITGKQFRSELLNLFCGRCSSSSAGAIDNVRVARRGQTDTTV